VIGLLLTVLFALALLSIGSFAIVAPRASSVQYGVVSDDPRALAYLRAMGVRDFVIGALLLLLVVAGSSSEMAIGLVVASAIAVLDFLVVRREGGSARALAPHAGGAVAMWGAAALVSFGV